MDGKSINCMAWLGAAVFIGACQSGPAGPHRASQAAGARPRDHTQVPVPPGIAPSVLAPLSGDALERARLNLPQIIATLSPPPFLRRQEADAPRQTAETGTPEAPPDSAPDDPPLAAQRAYVAGREAWHQGQIVEAKRQLELALRLAPKRPEILRLLGRLYTVTGNKIRGAYYLKQAVATDPTHPESLFLLGRFSLEQGRWSEAITTLHAATKLLEGERRAGPAVRRLVHHYLGAALTQDRYAAAAIDQYHAFLGGSTALRRITPFARELVIHDRQAGRTWTSVGDLHHLLNEPEAALAAYQRATETNGADHSQLLKRLVYTQLRLGRDDEAQRLVAQRISQSHDDDATLRLVRYLADLDIRPTALEDHLQSLYERQDRPASLALAIADLLPPDRGRVLLIQHLQDRPADQTVFERLLHDWLLLPGAPDLAEAIGITGAAMTAAPDLAESYGARLARAAADRPALLESFASVPETQRRQPVMLVLHGIMLAGTGALDQAQALFEQAMAGDPDLKVARLQLVKVMIVRKQFDRAAALLEPLGGSQDPGAISLRVRVLTETGRVAEALELINQMIHAGSATTPLIVQKARLQRRRGDGAAAERTLLDALDVHPRDEMLYAELFELYDSPQHPRDIDRQYQRLMVKMLGTIPHSRIARLKRAQWHAVRREFTRAEGLLLDLLAENGRDVTALSLLLEVYTLTGRQKSAIKLIEQKLNAFPNDLQLLEAALDFYTRIEDSNRLIALLQTKLEAEPNDQSLLMLALTFYERIRDSQRSLAIQERLLLLQPEGPERSVGLAVTYLRMNRPAQAVQAIEEIVAEDDNDQSPALLLLLAQALGELGRLEDAAQQIELAVQRFPDQAAEIRYRWAGILGALGERQRAEQALLDLLERYPKHVATKNDLGYLWAVQNKNLRQAHAMIKEAAHAEPNNAAYMDSLGWVLYKLGAFKDAEKWLRKALAAALDEAREGVPNRDTLAVVGDHLGDVLYRMDNQKKATQQWQRAREQLPDNMPNINDPELSTLRDRATAKIEAVQQNRAAPVADLPSTPDGAPEEPPAPEVAEQAPAS